MATGFVGIQVSGLKQHGQRAAVVRPRSSPVVAVAAADTSAEVEAVVKKGFYPGVSDAAVDMMSFVRCHKSILARGGLSSTQAQLFTKNDTAKTWITDLEYETNDQHLPGVATSKKMAELVDEIAVNTSKAIKAQFPSVSEKDIAVLEFDMRNNILRILSYGVAAHGREGFLHEGNVKLYQKIFENLGLPEDFFRSGVMAAKAETSKIAAASDKAAVESVFDYLASLA